MSVPANIVSEESTIIPMAPARLPFSRQASARLLLQSSRLPQTNRHL